MPNSTMNSSAYVATPRTTERRVQARPAAEQPLLGGPFRWTQRAQNSLPVTVEGQLPQWLQGQLVRTAPAVFERAHWHAEHWFDGLGLMYGFTFGAGVQFTQRLLASEAAADAEQPRNALASFDTPTKRSLWQRLIKPIPQVTDNANVNVLPWQGAWLAMTESQHQHVIGSDDLASRGLYRYDDRLPRDLSMTAHPHFDFERSALVNVGIRLGPKSELYVYRQGLNSHERVVEGRLSFKRMPYVHSFGLTPRHAIVIGHPFALNPLKLAFSNRPFAEGFTWRPEQGTRFWLLDRETGRFSDQLAEALFCFHIVNAFDDGDAAVLDLLAYDDAGFVADLKTARLAQKLPDVGGRFVRARLYRDKPHARLETLSEQRFDFPAIPYGAHNGKAYDTAWGAHLSEQTSGNWLSALVRVDLRGGQVTRYSEPDVTYGEPVFVPKPDATQANEGVLLSVGSHTRDDRTRLVVLDATRMEPLAHCTVPLSLPLGFHGNFAFRR